MAVGNEQELEQLEEATTPSTEDGTQIPKFKSAEDRDTAYIELEKRSHSQAQELAELRRRMEDYSQSQQLPSQRDSQGPSFTDQYKSQEELKAFWNRFASNPKEIFREVQEEVLREAEARVVMRDQARDAIADFKVKHPDLAPYEEIVTMFVTRQPTNLSARERLERAALEARKMIANIAQSGQPSPAPSVDPSTFIESPSSSRAGGTKAPVAKTASESDEVDDYFAERRANMRSVPPAKGAAA